MDPTHIQEMLELNMKIAKESAPQLASRMAALESGMLALLGQHQA